MPRRESVPSWACDAVAPYQQQLDRLMRRDFGASDWWVLTQSGQAFNNFTSAEDQSFGADFTTYAATLQRMTAKGMVPRMAATYHQAWTVYANAAARAFNDTASWSVFGCVWTADNYQTARDRLHAAEASGKAACGSAWTLPDGTEASDTVTVP